MKKSNQFVILVIAAFLAQGCNKTAITKFSGRMVASNSTQNEEWMNEVSNEAAAKNQHAEFPAGLSTKEKAALWHLSEGSEIFPTLWMINLKSMTTTGYEGSYFLDDMDKKFGALKDYSPENTGYPIKWVGMTAAWDGENPETQDVVLSNGETLKDLPKVRKLANGKPTVMMSGVNCAFCHTGVIENVVNGKVEKKIIEGAPSLVDPRGFFQDMVGSVVKTLLDKKELAEFLARNDVANSDKIAEELSAGFSSELGIEKTLLTSVIDVLQHGYFIGDKVKAAKAEKAKAMLFAKREVLTAYFIKLLKLTHNLNEVPELQQLRMRYLANFLAGDPDLIQTKAGHGRTDAFGRISNAVARGRSPIALTAPVSFPSMYSIKYKSNFHYNSNTNSVVTRNVGQAFGLGAILTNPNGKGDEKYASTVNLHNLIKLERLLYKLEVPQLQSIFPSVKINTAMAVSGCNVYRSKCIGCHEAQAERVGPAKMLIYQKVPLLEKVATNDIYIKNQMTPVYGKPFRDAIMGFTENVKNYYFKTHNISKQELAQWANEEIRGTEVFRDTYLGDSRFKGNPAMDYINIEKGHGYVAPNLAGVWATAPYLHNGSIPNIDELLKPAHLRMKKFIVGNTQYDFDKLGFVSVDENHKCVINDPHCFDVAENGNSNEGHEPSMYGGELQEQQKRDLKEFLKVLAPDAEYSWSNAPVYKVVDGKCVSRE